MRAKQSVSFWRRHRWLKFILIGVAVAGVVVLAAIIIVHQQAARFQAKLQPFYNTAGLSLTGQPGEVVRQEPLGVEMPGGKGVRVLYRTQRVDGSPTFSSGMVFLPDKPAGDTATPVVAWAHGTLGMGSQCAPSRTADPLKASPWISSMLQKGWIVTATDYAGFGTPGVQGYLVGGDEAHDVLNSVRAARQLDARADSRFVVWGHSQGGNSALFTAEQAGTYTPELRLLGTVASAPAAELVALLNEQYGTAVDWVIGPLVVTSWPAANPALDRSTVLTSLGGSTYQAIADQCIVPATFEGLIRTALKQQFFSRNPIDVPAWREMAEEQSAPILASSQPLLVVESQTDKVVLPNTTALYITDACKAKSNLTSLWLDNVAHQNIPFQSASQVIGWIGGRFAGIPPAQPCTQKLPVTPISP